MRGLYRWLDPFTPDSSGACAVFADTPAIVMPVDVRGVALTFSERVGLEKDSPMHLCPPRGAEELPYVLGDEDAFLASFEEGLGSQDGDFVVLIQGPVSSMTGLDLDRLAHLLEERILKPVLAVNCTGGRFYDAGISQALHAVLDRADSMMPRTLRPQTGSINVLGLNSVDHNDPRMRWMLAETLLDQSCSRIVSYWGCFGGWQEWCYARAAERNVVASASCAKLAQDMERRWGTPYVFMDELGLSLFGEETAHELESAARSKRILVIGEQIVANLVRTALLGRASHDEDANITVASFFNMAPERRQAQDVHFESEQDCVDLLASGAFDAVVCDTALQRFLPVGTCWYELPHSAISQAARHPAADKAVALSEAWFRGLAQALETSREKVVPR